MTTDQELLAKIDKKEKCLDSLTAFADESEVAIIREVFKALRAVVELHKKFQFTDESQFYHCEECQLEYAHEGKESTQYPCPTIQAIEKELG